MYRSLSLLPVSSEPKGPKLSVTGLVQALTCKAVNTDRKELESPRMLPTCNYTSKMALVCGVMGADVLMPTPCVFQGGSCTASLGTSLRAPPSSWSCEKKRQKEGQKKALSTSPRKKTFYSFSFHRCNQIDHIFIPSHISCLPSLQRLALEGFLSQLVRC